VEFSRGILREIPRVIPRESPREILQLLRDSLLSGY